MITLADPLPDDIETAHQLIRELLETLSQQLHLNAKLQHQLEELLRQRDGRKSERVDPAQLWLFAQEILAQAKTEPEPEPQPEAASEPPPAPSAPKPKKKGHGRKPLPASLPRKPQMHDVPPEQLPCPDCGAMRQCSGPGPRGKPGPQSGLCPGEMDPQPGLIPAVNDQTQNEPETTQVVGPVDGYNPGSAAPAALPPAPAPDNHAAAVAVVETHEKEWPTTENSTLLSDGRTVGGILGNSEFMSVDGMITLDVEGAPVPCPHPASFEAGAFRTQRKPMASRARQASEKPGFSPIR